MLRMFILSSCRKLQCQRLQPWQCAIGSCTLPAQQHRVTRYSTDGIASSEMAVPLTARLSLTAVWGANTGVGKTLGSVGLAAAATRMQLPLLYVKPVQTGFPQDSDARLVAAASNSVLQLGDHAAHLVKSNTPHVATLSSHADDRLCKVLHAWAAPVSPHSAVQNEGRAVTDRQLIHAVVNEIQQFNRQFNADNRNRAACRTGLGLIETAGGVASPGPSGNLMCDVLRPLRLPALLIGDPRLGGISATITAYDSLIMRGYDVNAILLLDPSDNQASMPPVEEQLHSTIQNSQSHRLGRPSLGNAEAIRDHLHKSSIHRLGHEPTAVISIAGCPPASGKAVGNTNQILDEAIQQWLQDTGTQFESLVSYLNHRHLQRLQRLSELRDKAMSHIWWPFTQHASLQHGAVQVVDSRAGEHLVTFQQAGQQSQQPQPQQPETTSSAQSSEHALVPLFDACASWWTQAANSELQPELARSVAYAAGRYLHVLSPQIAQQVAVDAAVKLLQTVGGSWATRAFFSDDGSTAIEVALKMAFRKYLAGLPAADQPPELKVVGLQNAYHGDTLGAMDCVAPSIFNAPSQAPWYRGRGVFFHPPYVAMADGVWRVLDTPQWLSNSQKNSTSSQEGLEKWTDFDALIAADRDDSPLTRVYRQHIEGQLDNAVAPGSNTHLAALIIEPLIQGAGGMLLVDPQFQRQLVLACRERGVPVIFDEVMTGLYRLGNVTASRYLRLDPDIACFAKLMTAGVVPMAATLASEDVFNSFKGDSKLQALLHGHSYTAYPVGCATTLAALEILNSPTHNPNLCTPKGDHPTCPTPETCKESCSRLRPCWDNERVVALSRHPLLAHATAVGTVFAAKLRVADAGQGGYGSNIAANVVTKLRDEHGIYARPLGDVVYLMVTPTTDSDIASQMLDSLRDVLDKYLHGAYKDNGSQGDGCVV